MTNNIRSRNKNQAFKNTSPEPLIHIVNNPLQYFTSMSGTKKDILDSLIYLDAKHHKVFVSQDTLAHRSGVSRETANRLLRVLEEEGLITSIYRHMTTCVYHISPWLKRADTASKIRHIFPSLKAFLMINLLIANAAAYQAKQTRVTQDLISYKYLLKSFNLLDSDYSRVSSIQEQDDRYWTQTFKKVKFGALYMDYQISEAAKNLKSFTPTKWAHISLSAFPDAAIEWADDILKNRKSITDPFKYLTRLCTTYCQERGLAPDFNFSREMAVYFHMPDKPVFIELNKNNPQPAESNYAAAVGAKQPILLKSPKFAEMNASYKPQPSYQRKEYQKREGKSTYKPIEWRDPDRTFKVGCTMDHEGEIAKLISEDSIQSCKQLGNLIGHDKALVFYEKMVENHKDCLRTNHDRQH